MVNSREVKDDLGDVGPAIEWVGGFIDQAGLSADVRFAIDLSLEEALANLIVHGKCAGDDKAIVVSVAADAEGATITLTDRCAPFDATKHRDRVDETGLKIGGRGLLLMQSFAGELDYSAGSDGNTLTMRFPARKALAAQASTKSIPGP
jgi:anti-sigma regulatory factor (Ser/Thr protein kinase)